MWTLTPELPFRVCVCVSPFRSVVMLHAYGRLRRLHAETVTVSVEGLTPEMALILPHWECMICKQFVSEPVLLRHVQQRTSACAALACRACVRTWQDSYRAGATLPCPLCRQSVHRSADDDADVAAYIAAQIEDLPSECTICGFRGANRAAVRAHQENDCSLWQLRAALETHRGGDGCACDCGAAPPCCLGARIADLLDRVAAGDVAASEGAVTDWMRAHRLSPHLRAIRGCPRVVGLWLRCTSAADLGASEAVHAAEALLVEPDADADADANTIRDLLTAAVWASLAASRPGDNSVESALRRIPEGPLLTPTLSDRLWRTLTRNEAAPRGAVVVGLRLVELFRRNPHGRTFCFR